MNRSASTASKHRVSGSISLLYSRFFSPFPHGTSSLSVSEEYLALEGGPPGFKQDFTCPVLLRYHLAGFWTFVYRAITFSGVFFQKLPLVLALRFIDGPTTPSGAPDGLGYSPFARRY